jgi:hypothetical protein
LVLLRRFPKKQQFRGRQIGWLRADVLEWIARDLATDEKAKRTNFGPHRDRRRNPRQACLPLECRPPCVGRGNLP